MGAIAHAPATGAMPAPVLRDLERRTFLNLLQLTNRLATPEELAWELVVLAQCLSGCEAVALRLKRGPDFPYAAQLGFSERFITLENPLCLEDSEGRLLRDRKRNPLLACICGCVLRDQLDPAHPCATSRGSFVTNGTSELVACPAQLEAFDEVRGRCHTAGYETVGLFPIRRDGVTYGLIQCNDPAPARLTPEACDLLECLADTAAHLFQQDMA